MLPPTVPGRLPRADLHRRPRAAVRRAPDARDVPRLGGRGDAASASCRSAAAGSIEIRRTQRRVRLRGAAADPLGAGRAVRARRGARRPRRRRATRSSTPRGSTTGPGWLGVLLRSAEEVLALRAAADGDADVGVAALRPDGGARGARVLPRAARRRGPGHRQPQRVARRVAARDRPRCGALRRAPGHGARAHRPRARQRGRRAGLGGAGATIDVDRRGRRDRSRRRAGHG